MKKAIRRIGAFTSGGDAPGTNAVTRAVVRTSLHMGIECVGIRRGYHDLINGDLTKLTSKSVSDLSRRGGTMLYSARSEEFEALADQERTVATCKMLRLDVLVGIGGDGIFSDLLCLAKRGFSVVGIPSATDNDIARSSYAVGYDTACNTALESINKLRDTMQFHEHCSVVEVMGHRAGHPTLIVGVAYGATAVIVPEHPVDYGADLLESIRQARLAGRTHSMIIVVESVEGGAYFAGKAIEEATVLDTRVTALGHTQWGGSPFSRDRITVTYIGYEAVYLSAEGKTRRVVALQGENYVDYDIIEALQMTKSLDQHTYKVMRALIGVR